MEGLKEAMRYLVEELSTPYTREHEGMLFADKKMYRVHQELPVAQPFVMTTLSGFVDYIRSNTDKMREKMLVHIESPYTVSLQSELDDDRIREKMVVVNAKTPDFIYENFYSSEKFTIKLMAQFADTDGSTDKNRLLKYTGTVQAGTVRNYGDDGVSQAAVIQKTLTTKDEDIVPNPVTLRPYRTFLEVEQPESQFIFRAKDVDEDVAFALFEADGGAWEIDAMKSIKEYLEKALADVSIPGTSFTIIS